MVKRAEKQISKVMGCSDEIGCISGKIIVFADI